MGKIIVKKVITRKPGCLYYVDGAGNVCEAKMARGGGKRRKREDNFLLGLLFLFYLIIFIFNIFDGFRESRYSGCSFLNFEFLKNFYKE